MAMPVSSSAVYPQLMLVTVLDKDAAAKGTDLADYSQAMLIMAKCLLHSDQRRFAPRARFPVVTPKGDQETLPVSQY